jgi:hypothetical protein
MPHPTIRLRAAVPAALALLAVLAACGGAAAPTGSARQLAASRGEATIAPGLVQSVTLTPTSPASDDEVTIRSVLVNRGGSPIAVESRLCGLDYAGTLTLTHPPAVLKCGGYSQHVTLAPGDSTVTADLMRVSVRPGTYELRVRQSVAPEGWAALQVTVLGG